MISYCHLIAILIIVFYNCTSSSVQALGKGLQCRKPRGDDKYPYKYQGGIDLFIDKCINSSTGNDPLVRFTCKCEHIAGPGYPPDLVCTDNTMLTNRDILEKWFCIHNCFCRPTWKQIANMKLRRKKPVTAYQPLRDIKESEETGKSGELIESSNKGSCASSCSSNAGCLTVRDSQPGCANAVCGLDQQTAPGPWFGKGTCMSMIDTVGKFRGKRDLDGPFCPCNSTFASRGCCREQSGIVHEGAQMTLE